MKKKGFELLNGIANRQIDLQEDCFALLEQSLHRFDNEGKLS
jgi:hypothetical protein